ncbi:MAG TPA: ADP-ribosylglycohydrolase family protein [Acidimicrobiales bacterium]|nr:ADP-ribosylglycohydrolase family protein [Acidimicrobiales bacterium]
MTDGVYAELDRALGPVALMSLQSRGLLPTPGIPAAESLPSRDVLLDRVTGALIGAAVGNALGRLSEKEQRRRGYPHHVAEDRIRAARLVGSAAKVRAGVQELVISAEALLDHGAGAPSAVSDELVRRIRKLRVPGRAAVATVEQRRAGVPWFEAGPGSFGEGALCRAVAAGLIYADDSERRWVMSGLDAAVTHASLKAIKSATIVAESIAALVRGEAIVPAASPSLDTVAIDQEAETTTEAALALLHARRDDPVGTIAAAACVPGSPDTFAALAGALVGATCGVSALPDHWTARVELAGDLRALAARIVARLLHDPEAETESRIWFLLDRSGSMQSIAESVVGGCNTFFAEQRAMAGSARVTFVQFDDREPHEVLLDDVDVASVVPLSEHEFIPRGNTPLLDAVALLLDRAEGRGAAPTDNLVVVFTDGEENASRRWDRARLFRRISDLQAKGWTFVFLGANQDSYLEAGSFGIAPGSVSNFRATPSSVAAAYAGLGRATREWRGKSARLRMADSRRFWGDRKEAEEEDGD